MQRMKTWLKRLRRADRGAAALEFALVAPMLMVMATGLIDFGLAIRAKSEVEGAARAGLQKGFGNMWDAAAITTAAKNAFSTKTADQDSLTVEATPSCYCDGTMTASGSDCTKTTTCGGGAIVEYYLTVKVTQTHDMLLKYYVFPSQLTLTSSATARAQPGAL
ncbi:MAG: pilus assembly protein [Proteobacteria bacterium]|nr:pilus assembly protein [Pseudomonadota bacterium]